MEALLFAVDICTDSRNLPVPERGSHSHLTPSLLGHRCEWMWDSRNLRSRDMLQHRWQLYLHLPSRLHASERGKQLHGWVCVSGACRPGSHLQRSVKHLGFSTALPLECFSPLNYFSSVHPDSQRAPHRPSVWHFRHVWVVEGFSLKCDVGRCQMV